MWTSAHLCLLVQGRMQKCSTALSVIAFTAGDELLADSWQHTVSW